MTTIDPTLIHDPTSNDPTSNDTGVGGPAAKATVMRRYLVVTAVATPANLAIYVALLLAADLPALLANLLAATAVTVPAYHVNRSWVWGVGADDARPAEVGQYWISSMVSVGASSVTLWSLTRGGASSVVLAVAPLAVYTALWAVRFLFLDRYLFRRSSGDAGAESRP